MQSVTPDFKSSMVSEFTSGSTAVLECNSNDFDHNFMFWLFGNNKVIGPGNLYDEKKYKYEVLSGKLHIGNVSPEEAGYYKCVSKKLDGSGFAVGEVDLIVSNSFSAIDAVKLVAIIVSIIVIIGCALLYYRMRRDWKQYEGRTIVPVDDVEEEEGDEIYNQTTTSINQPAPGPSRNQSSDQLLYGIDNQGLDTDFNSVFENIQIKSPQRDLMF